MIFNTLNWIQCTGNVWCNLINLNLTHPHFNNLEGVYIIWHGGPNPRTVRVGQGNIRDRLGVHRNEPEILAYRSNILYVTWANVSPSIRDGVESFLFDRLNPLVGSRTPDVLPINVNLPW